MNIKRCCMLFFIATFMVVSGFSSVLSEEYVKFLEVQRNPTDLSSVENSVVRTYLRSTKSIFNGFEVVMMFHGDNIVDIERSAGENNSFDLFEYIIYDDRMYVRDVNTEKANDFIPFFEYLVTDTGFTFGIFTYNLVETEK